MSQKDYISDNLITMRDRLRESTAAIRETAEQNKNELPSEEGSRSAGSVITQLTTDTPSDRRTQEGLRAKSDLAGRLARDLAKIHGMIAEQDRRSRELQKIREALQTLDKTLEQVTPANNDRLFAAETDRLRLEYFRLCGALDALTSGNAGNTTSGVRDEFKKENTTLQGAWIIGGAILAGAAIIAGITAMIFL